MMNKKLQKAFNDQINKELYSEYLYLAMKIYFQEQNLQGFANWFDVQVQEEHAHAMGMFDYMNERGGKLQLEAIEKPVVEGDTPLTILNMFFVMKNLSLPVSTPLWTLRKMCVTARR